MMFERNSFVKWTIEDEGEQITYIAQIKSSTDHRVTMDIAGPNGGTLEVDVVKDEGTFSSTTKPKGWKVSAPSPAPVERKKAKKQKKAGGPTKKEQALILVRDTYGKGHGKDIAIQRIQDVLDMSKAGATTYFYAAKKVVDQDG